MRVVFAVVLSSWLAFGPSRARYDSVGEPRASSEKELILCNMMARRADVLELGGRRWEVRNPLAFGAGLPHVLPGSVAMTCVSHAA